MAEKFSAVSAERLVPNKSGLVDISVSSATQTPALIAPVRFARAFESIQIEIVETWGAVTNARIHVGIAGDTDKYGIWTPVEGLTAGMYPVALIDAVIARDTAVLVSWITDNVAGTAYVHAWTGVASNP